MKKKLCFLAVAKAVLLLLMLQPFSLVAEIIGTNTAASPLTFERIEALPESERQAWRDYLERSVRQRKEDQDAFRRELQEHKIPKASVPTETSSRRGVPLGRPAEWYRSAEAQRIASNIVTFQTPAGGWGKNMDMISKPRSPGMFYAPASASRFQSAADFDIPQNGWSYVGTIDNEGTTLQLRFLARVISASTNPPVLKESFLRGLNYLFNAQYPNGGWPQVWPLDGGYHDAVTFNDNAVVNVMNLLWEVSRGTDTYAFVPEDYRRRASNVFSNGLRCVLASQVIVDGQRTVWPQQCDALTLQPTSARNFEMSSLASMESAAMVRFLMRLSEPGRDIIQAVDGAINWFEKTAIRDKAYRSTGPEGRFLVDSPGSGPIWARYYEVGTNRPLFGDRDKTIHDRIDEISSERRAGYAWFTGNPAEIIKDYAQWRRQHVEKVNP